MLAERDERLIIAYLGAFHDLQERRSLWQEIVAWTEIGLEYVRFYGDKRREAVLLANLGAAWAALGEVKRALELQHQRLAIEEALGDETQIGRALGNLGSVYHRLGEVSRAVAYYQRALAIARSTGDRSNEGIWLQMLGFAYVDLGDAQRN
ncbi:MAG: tetratricopeptide repeat protein [Anaerolineae bacterium]|nr:MAG: tetratricopeptide repeat protein [Anaerolineae bacterium]